MGMEPGAVVLFVIAGSILAVMAGQVIVAIVTDRWAQRREAARAERLAHGAPVEVSEAALEVAAAEYVHTEHDTGTHALRRSPSVRGIGRMEARELLRSTDGATAYALVRRALAACDGQGEAGLYERVLARLIAGEARRRLASGRRPTHARRAERIERRLWTLCELALREILLGRTEQPKGGRHGAH